MVNVPNCAYGLTYKTLFFFLQELDDKLYKNGADDGALSSDEELSGGEMEMEMKSEDGELKDRLLRMYGDHINTLKLEFSKKKKKGKLPKEARQTLLEWWNVHYKWPYPTVSISDIYYGGIN